ncbi:hypothetical protein BCR34DRAFT_614953 [Clohesyomyces aquaticus]|uniref:C2H2-type domain-containing protein n=1 Tax=Clohesyomyces aquaticus TaxID=1231657 RepID=A0A1Y1ZKU1_9PLEO|nr:hypothetical protein BCR34DRAFT_614953 [Clohesyomyces aquaticus]
MNNSTESRLRASIVAPSWVTNSARPLNTFELASAVSQSLGYFHTRGRGCTWEFVFDACKPLLEETRSGSVNLIHFTVREYYLNGSGKLTMPPLNGRLEVTPGCLKALVKGLDLLDTSQPQDQQDIDIAEIVKSGYGLVKDTDRASDGEEWSALVDVLDILDEHHQAIEESVRKHGLAPESIEDVQDKSVPSFLMGFPYLSRMVFRAQRFDGMLKQQAFRNGQDAEKYRLEKDPTLFGQVIQSLRGSIFHLIQTKDPRMKAPLPEYALYCRFWSCGEFFRTEKKLEEHELFHCGGIRCNEPSCPFHHIGFTLFDGLKRHTRKYHPPAKLPAKSTVIRRRFLRVEVFGGRSYGCGRRFCSEEGLEVHRASRRGTLCDRDFSAEVGGRKPSDPDGTAHITTNPKSLLEIREGQRQRIFEDSDEDLVLDEYDFAESEARYNKEKKLLQSKQIDLNVPSLRATSPLQEIMLLANITLEHLPPRTQELGRYLRNTD